MAADLKEFKGKNCHELMAWALDAKLNGRRGLDFSLCSIINAKSGNCSEDCRFCVQSAHYHTNAPVYGLKERDEILQAAGQAKENQASHFSLVTSGRGLGAKDLKQAAEAITAIREQVGIKVCASFGILGLQDFKMLKEAGLSRYHHNLETSREFFPNIVSTHSFQERIDTIDAAHEAGLEVCAGGIFGLGETEDDRISMALSLRDCGADSVPINILIPLPGTPLAHQPPLSVIDALRGIAIYRILMPDIPIRLAAGRETALQDFLGSAFMAGADGMMIGGYLTEHGRMPKDDLNFAAEMRQIWQEMIPV